MRIAILITLIYYSNIITGQNTDLKREAEWLMVKGEYLYKHVLACKLTQEKYITSDNLVLSYKSGNELKAIEFTKQAGTTEVLKTVTYDWNTLSLIGADLSIKKEDGIEALYRKMYLKIYSSGFYNTLYTDFWVVFEKPDDKFLAYIIPMQNDDKLIIFGNDYLFTFDKNGEFIDFKPLHTNPIPVSLKSPPDIKVKGTVHTHAGSSSEFMSPTDIAAMLLLKDKIEWEKHYVISGKYKSIYNVKEGTLVIEPKE